MEPKPSRLSQALFLFFLISLFVLLASLDFSPALRSAAGLSNPHTTAYTNPILYADFPDPSVLNAPDGWIYVHATQGITPEGEFINIQVARTKDFVQWESLPDALPKKPIWANHTQDFWAPHVVFHDGTYFMYYSADSDTGPGMCLGVATAVKPSGPFVDVGEPLKCGSSFVNIDPMAFDDPQTGKRLLYWGSGFFPIAVQELTPDRTSFLTGTNPTYLINPRRARPYERLVEGAWVTFRDGYYYLFYSGDSCCGPQAHYAVMVARSQNAFGPFEKLGDANGTRNSVILEGNETWTAPGHNAVLTDSTGQDWIFYHAINAKEPLKGDPVPTDDYYIRVLMIDRIIYKDGWPQVEGRTPSTTEQGGPSLP